MRKFFALLSRELKSYFYSPIAYIVLVFFLIVSGMDFWFRDVDLQRTQSFVLPWRSRL